MGNTPILRTITDYLTDDELDEVNTYIQYICERRKKGVEDVQVQQLQDHH